MRRTPRRAYDREGGEIAPPTVGSLRQQGETTAAVFCHARDCGHHAVVSTDRFPADLPFPDIALRLRCSACGSRAIGVMKAWRPTTLGASRAPGRRQGCRRRTG